MVPFLIVLLSLWSADIMTDGAVDKAVIKPAAKAAGEFVSLKHNTQTGMADVSLFGKDLSIALSPVDPADLNN